MKRKYLFITGIMVGLMIILAASTGVLDVKPCEDVADDLYSKIETIRRESLNVVDFKKTNINDINSYFVNQRVTSAAQNLTSGKVDNNRCHTTEITFDYLMFTE